ncbi:pilus assembly PilX family protein [Massilia niastensis]|uniref:pilus assembly PilX family protein n=1 Tax=Massilia niastensis TaxID=544911 RepID=UPI0003789CFB|nr:hypothetical protein [Massilia niastensis]
MDMRHDFPMTRRRQGGVALLTALVLMLAVLMTGIAAARTALQGARAAESERDRLLALQMAEAGLADAEADIEGGAAPASARSAALASGDPAAFADGCAGGRPYDGLCRPAAGLARQAELLADPDGPAVRFGAYTGRRMPEGEGGLPAAPPRYLIELMPPGGPGHLYRITALGSGSTEHAQVALQAFYRKPAEAGAAGRRIGWRELGNWAALGGTGAPPGGEGRR